jgi:hypothetical protein
VLDLEEACMDRRRVLLSAVVVGAVGLLAAVSIPAIAGTGPHRPTRAQPAVDTPAEPEMVAAPGRDLSLSDDQVRARLVKEAVLPHDIPRHADHLPGRRA